MADALADTPAGTGNNHKSPAEQGRRVRHRTVFTAWQLQAMQRKFDQTQYLVGEERRLFAQHIGLDQMQVKVWFQNRRIKWRREQQLQQRRRIEAAKKKYGFNE